MASPPADTGNRREHRRQNLQRLLQPRQVAVIGGGAAVATIRQLDHIGFTGAIWPVNPNRVEMGGRACYAAVEDLPTGPDAAVVAVPAAACPAVFAALNAHGAGGGVCFAAGFAEDGLAEREAELVTATGDMALVGPNAHGLINGFDHAALWPDDHGAEPVASGCALISQSGNVALSATFQQRSVPLGYIIGTGNQAQTGLEDYIDALLDDARVHAIGLFIEGLRDVAGFARAARRALVADVALIALKVGTSAGGARASKSHTAALTGADRVYAALFERLGVRRVDTLAELLETLKLASVSGPLAGRRVVSLSCSGGEAAVMGDRLEAAALTCPAPTNPARIAEAFRLRPASVGNPLDYNTRIWGDAEASASGFEAVLANPYDAAVLVLDFPPPGRCDPGNWRAALDGFLQAQRPTETAATVLASLPEALPREAREACVGAGVTPLQGLDEGVKALAHMAAWRERRAALLDCPDWAGPLPAPTTCAADSLDEAASKAWLAEAGVPIPAGRTVAADAVAAGAAELGFPLVVKAASPGLDHKSELGAVALGLDSADAAVAAVQAMRARLEAAGHAGEHFLLERMVDDAVAELMVGVVADATAGPVLVLGSGGVLAELVGDTRTLLLPTEPGAIRSALASLAVGHRLTGYRGGSGGDLDAAVAACTAIARFAEANAARIAELDVNPLLVCPPGRGAVAADALVRVAVEVP
jgi:acetyl-CoA synthetase